jgi:phosphoribosyl-AMP cyclohydrolase
VESDVEIDFEKMGGLVPVITQDAISGKVLMIAYTNRDAFEETLKTGRAVYWSRSRNKLWLKGEESGNYQEIVEILIDCDRDSLLYRVKQMGAACHEGYKSCFYRSWKNGGWVNNGEEKLFNPREVYKR